MILPQELEVFYVIPAIRRELARALKKRGLSQKNIANLFGVTEACVSNYKSKRGQDVKFTPEITKLINSCADEISKGETCFIKAVQRVCKDFKKDKCLCDLHHKMDNITCNCGGCL